MKRIATGTTSIARNLRNNATPAERQLWNLLSPYRPRFTRQYPVGPFIIDIVCRQAKLAIELDGGQHSMSAKHDEKRTAWLESEGWTVIRIWNNDLTANPDAVAELILAKLEELTGIPPFRHEKRKPITE